MRHLSSLNDLCFSSAHHHYSPFLGELMEWFGDMQEFLDETSVEVDKPMNDWTSVTFWGVGQSQTPVTLTGSISTHPSKSMRPRYSTMGCSKVHF